MLGYGIDYKELNNEEYISLLNNVSTMIKDIGSLGFDVDSYVKELDIYKTPVNYLDKLLLLELKEKLQKYKDYFDVLNLIDMFFNKVNVNNSDNINKIVDDIINILKQIDFTVNLGNNWNNVVEKIFDGVYKIIKEEVLLSGDSRLYDYIKSNDLFNSYISVLINDEIIKLDINLNDIKYRKLSNKLCDLKSNGLGNYCYDLDVIKLLLYYEGKDVGKVVIDRLNDIILDVNSNYRQLSCVKYNLNLLNKDKRNLSILRKKILMRFTALALTVSITTGGGISIYKALKKGYAKDFVTKTATTYSSMEGLNITTEDILLSDSEKYDNKTYLKFYGLWGEEDEFWGTVEREIKCYDVSDVELSNIEDYLNYSFDKTNSYYTLITQTGYPNEVHRYDSPYIEVEKIDVDNSNKKSYISNKIEYYTFLAMAYVIYIGICSIMIFPTYFNSNSESVFSYFISLFEYLKEYISKRKYYLEKTVDLKSKIDEILNMVNSYEFLKIEFDRLYKENIYLLDNPEELYNKFEEAINSFNKEEIITAKRLLKGKE